jgi:hypothetical protein
VPETITTEVSSPPEVGHQAAADAMAMATTARDKCERSARSFMA